MNTSTTVDALREERRQQATSEAAAIKDDSADRAESQAIHEDRADRREG